MVRALLFTASALLLLASITMTMVWLGRARLPYNQEGRYFDAQTGVVLHEQSVSLFAGGAMLLGLTAIALFLIARRR